MYIRAEKIIEMSDVVGLVIDHVVNTSNCTSLFIDSTHLVKISIKSNDDVVTTLVEWVDC